MLFTKNFFHISPASLSQLFLTSLLCLAVATPLQAETHATPEQEASAEAKLQSTIENLVSIQKTIEQKQVFVSDLKNKLKKPDDAADKLELEQKINRIKSDITGLQSSFEQIALGGVNRAVFNDQPEQAINWQDELEQISRPLLSTLKELTAKPRQLDSLRRDIERMETQLKIIDKALESIIFFNSQKLPAIAEKSVNQLLIDWQQHKDDTQRQLALSQFKLENLATESDTWQTSTSDVISNFIHGRGQTLFFAILTGVLIWLLAKGVINLYWRWLYQAKHDSGISRAPLLYYSHRIVTVILIVFAILTVFYVRGDVLLLTLALVALVGAALTLRQTLPRYAAEIRLLLGVGPVRENERLILDGIAFQVDSLSVYTVLRNPELDGFVRLPLHVMDEHVSRPSRQESWFPCKPEDYVILASGSLARVMRQTIELVELMVMDSLMQIRTSDFIAQNVRNLTRDGYGIACTFGIDYQHQAICLDDVPEKFKTSVINRFEQADLKQEIKDIIVEFAAANTSSLDYRIYLVLKGTAGKAYYKAQRLVAQACVDTCNTEGWIIPFTQITVHSADKGNSTTLD